MHRYHVRAARKTAREYFSLCGMRHRNDPSDIEFCIALLETSQCHKFHQLMVHKKITFIATPDCVHQSCRDLYPDNFIARHYEFDITIPTDNDYLLRCADNFFTKGRVDSSGKRRTWYHEVNKEEGEEENDDKDRTRKDGFASELPSPNAESPQVGVNCRVEHTNDFYISRLLADSVEVYNTLIMEGGKGSEEAIITSGKKVQVKLFSSNNGRFVYAMTLIKKTRGRRSKRIPATTLRHVM